jgi:hypothetical protein
MEIADQLEGLNGLISAVDSKLEKICDRMDSGFDKLDKLDNITDSIDNLVKHLKRSRRQEPSSEVPLTREAAGKKMFCTAMKRVQAFRETKEVKRLRRMEDVDALVEIKWDALSAASKHTWEAKAMWAAYDANDSD